MDGDKGSVLCGGGRACLMHTQGLQAQVLKSLASCPPEAVPVCPGNGASQEVMSCLGFSSLLSAAFSQPELGLWPLLHCRLEQARQCP